MIIASEVLFESQQLPPPQDIRYAVFYIGAAQQAESRLLKDVAELKQKYIVQVDIEQRIVSIDINSDITVRLKIHPCYPHVSAILAIQLFCGLLKDLYTGCQISIREFYHKHQPDYSSHI